MKTSVHIKEWDESSYYKRIVELPASRTLLKIKNIEQDLLLQYLLLALITLSAAVLRFYKLGDWSFWLDEIYTFNRALDFSTTSIAETLIGVTIKLLGPSEWNARLAPAVIGILSIPLLYFPTRHLFGAAVAILSGAFLTVSPWHLYWSQNARMYSLVLLLYTLAFLIFLIGIEQDRFWPVLLSMFLLFLAINERAISLLFVPIVAAYCVTITIFFRKRPVGLRFRYLTLLIVPIVLFGLIDVYQYLQAGSIGVSRHQISATGGYSNIDVFITQFLGDQLANPAWLVTSAVHLIGVPLTCLAFFSSIYLLFAKQLSRHLFIILGAFVPLFSLLVLSFFSFANERYIFVALPCFTILGAIAVKELFVRSQNYGIILATGVFVLLLADPVGRVGLYYKYQNGYRHDWTNAFHFVQSQALKDDLVAVSYPEMGNYYLRTDSIKGSELNEDFVLESGKRVWYIDGVWGLPSIPHWLQEKSELVGTWDVQLPLRTLIMRVYLYDPDLRLIKQTSR